MLVVEAQRVEPPIRADLHLVLALSVLLLMLETAARLSLTPHLVPVLLLVMAKRPGLILTQQSGISTDRTQTKRHTASILACKLAGILLSICCCGPRIPMGPRMPIGAGMPPRPGRLRIDGGDRTFGTAGAEAMLAGGLGRGRDVGVPLARGAFGVSVVRDGEGVLKSFAIIVACPFCPLVEASPSGLDGASSLGSGEDGLSAGEDICSFSSVGGEDIVLGSLRRM